MQDPYPTLIDALGRIVPAGRLSTDPVRLLAYGTDASFYRLIPRAVVHVNTGDELARVLAECRRAGVPMTFRAAGTSLSGQAVSDSILIQLGQTWRSHDILESGAAIRLDPGVIGAHANRLLAPYGRKIGPDPASIGACMVGGIAANNASGMCCGTAQNSYRTVRDIKVTLVDGTVLDTANPDSVSRFRRDRADLVAALEDLGRETRAHEELAARIRHKYRLKNTVGYALNSLVDFSDGVEILKHLMIGSEGTLGFINSITYHTVPDEALKAAALVIFPDMAAACRATAALKGLEATPVAAVELMDRAALRSVEDTPGMEATLKGLPDGAAALLIDVRAEDEDTLAARSDAVHEALHAISTVNAVRFARDAETYGLYWNIRKGMFPAVGAVRDTGTTVVIEDVAFPMESLEEGVGELIAMLGRHGYHNAILFGHALEGNLHFVFPQGFDDSAEVARYQGMMDELAQLVGVRYGGSLKGEHGTGRNMAPFVELEWGTDAYQLMWRIKELFDPETLLNPEVMLSRNPHLHLQNLKPLPAADPIVDKCIECGFCEPVCPSRDLTLTPRQRIVVRREIARLERDGGDPERLAALRTGYAYDGIETCAATGLCAMPCPVNINTGDLVRRLREEAHAGRTRGAAFAARHFAGATALARGALRSSSLVHRLVGTESMDRITGIARRISGGRLPHWLPATPTAPSMAVLREADRDSGGARNGGTVVYLPSCATRMFGASTQESDTRSTMELTLAVLRKAGFRVIVPRGVNGLCCGMAFESKGLFEQADSKAEELGEVLMDASDGGRFPVLCDTSPCTLRMQTTLSDELDLHEPVEFIHERVLPRLTLTPKEEPIAVHVTCSSTRMGLGSTFVAVARACARNVTVPPDIQCCAFAGDKGFRTPELNASALSTLRSQVQGCVAGYSNSRTCEIGLTEHGGIPYRSIMALVDEVSQRRE